MRALWDGAIPARSMSEDGDVHCGHKGMDVACNYSVAYDAQFD